MKVLKYILIGSLILVTAFFAIGIIKPTVKYQVEVVVPRSPDFVFEAYNDTSLLRNWIPELVAMRVIEETPEITGSRYEMDIQSEGKIVTLKETVLEYINQKKLVLEFDTEMMTKTDTVEFLEAEEGTLVRTSVVFRGSNPISRSMFAFFGKQFSAYDQQYLNNFRDMVAGMPH